VREGYKETEIGVIPVDWEVVELGKVSDILDPHPSHRAPKEDPHGFPFVGIGDVSENGIIDIAKSRKISLDDVIQQNNSIQINKNDIGFGRVATVGKIIKFQSYDFPFALSPTMAVIKFFNIDNDFLYQFLSSDETRKQFKNFTSGSTRISLGIQNLRKLLISYPPLKEQEKIADILLTADDKIEAIALQIQKAETLKKGLLQKLLSEGIGHTEFKDSELGKIPVGWEIVKLKDILTVKYGKNQKDVEDENGKYPILGTGGLMGYANKFLYDKPSVLIGRKGTIDKPQYKDTPFWTVDTLFYTDIKENLTLAKYVYFKFLTIQWRTYNEASGVPSLSAPNIHAIKMQLPPLEEQKEIANILSTVDEKLKVLRAKKEKYETLKQGLMQKLLTGEVRMKI